MLSLTALSQYESISQNRQNQLLAQAIDNIVKVNANDVVFLDSEVSSDFESLLLQGRAALDRLINFISRHYGNYTDRFSKLREVLQILKEMKRRMRSLRYLMMLSGLRIHL
jgi:hypothetical protein